MNDKRECGDRIINMYIQDSKGVCEDEYIYVCMYVCIYSVYMYIYMYVYIYVLN